jgi:tetratricopeptide (TPR) repeat protein
MKRISFLLLLSILTAITIQAQSSRSAKDHLRRGIAKFSQGDIEGAISNYEKAIEMNPRFAEAFFNRGKARRAKGDLNGAIADFEACVEMDPRLAENNRDIASAYYNRGFIRTNGLEVYDALSDFDAAIRFNPNHVEAHIKRGEAHLILGQFRKAIADFDSSLEMKPPRYSASLAFAGRGFARLLQGDEDGAEKDFAECVKLNTEGKFFLELHLKLLEAQMREVKRRRYVSPERVA